MNRLSKESSPYLLQHKDNPVDWYAWGNLAFGEAQRLDRPILLSIGYSACHWCHVMAHESFEDLATARLMNSLFINIKVDREERPDIDHIYMNFVQMSTGSGGWPLTVFLTPDLVPFYGGTYFPPEERFGRMGFKDLLRVISDTYKFRKDEITEKKGEILEALAGSGRLEAQRPEAQKSKAHRPATQGDPSDAPAEKPDGLSAPDFETCFTTISSIYDARHGGFYNAPKFPMPSLHFFLLHHYAATSREAPLEMVENTLDSMAQGGIYDHAGGGFHRYATDNHWMIPHFEKMLYDNALLMQLYTDAFRITKHKRYLEIAEETARFLMRDMKDAGSGGYYSSLDADSEGQEGIYYTYDYNELHKYLDADELALAEKHFGVIKDGNFEGRNILHTSFSPDDMTGRLLKSASELKEKLLSLRQKRTPPGLDTKILVSWNALLARSFALLYAVTGSGRYLAEAEGIARLILDNCFDNGRLCHSYRKDDTVIEGMLDDYAFSSEALLTLFEVTQKEGYLHASVSLMEALLKEFYSPDENEFFFTHSSQSNLIVRPVNAFDNSILSGNSSAVITLIRLSAITGNTEYIQTAGKYITARRALLKSEPQNYSYLLCASYLYSLTPAEVAFIASDEESIPRFISEFFGHYFPFASVAASVDARDTKVGLLEGKRALSGLNTYYLCRNFACSSPVHDFSELKEILESKSR